MHYQAPKVNTDVAIALHVHGDCQILPHFEVDQNTTRCCPVPPGFLNLQTQTASHFVEFLTVYLGAP